jgi:DNA polymerase elongation subunit (family B)
MYLKKVPETDEGKIRILQAAIDCEELNDSQTIILPAEEIGELRIFITSYESALFVWKQTVKDLTKSQAEYTELFKNAQIYISHFIQVLQLTVIRKEIKFEVLSDYGFESREELALPDLSTEEPVIYWGGKIIRGEAKRISLGGYPLYNPAIAKVKVHYELFLEIAHTIKIYKQNMVRHQAALYEMQKKAKIRILDIWSRIDDKYGNLPFDKLLEIYQSYKISYHYQIELF